MKTFPPSELIINADGSAFHLHLRPEQLADRVILVGDPGRVSTVAEHFSERECEVSSREFHSITGTYQGKRMTVLSTGIGCDNIDIVMTELDALANIDFDTRTEKAEHRTLTIVRIGTCGGLQPFTPTGSFIASVKSIGFDGLLNYYDGRNEVCDLELEEAFKQHITFVRRYSHTLVFYSQGDESRLVSNDDSDGFTCRSELEGVTQQVPENRVHTSAIDPNGRVLRLVHDLKLNMFVVRLFTEISARLFH